MRKLNLIFLSVVILLLTGLACILPGVSITDPNAISTSAAQTVVAKLTGYPPSPTLFLTFTFEPTQTPSLTPSVTETHPPIIIPTFTPSFPSLSVSVATNCRSGPGLAYGIVGYLLVGETAQVYGRDASNLYWFIRNPDDQYGFCWISGKYATFFGNLSSVPVYTPEPTQTQTPYSSFFINYVGLDSCQNWWAEFNLTNNSSNTYRSVKITVRDTVTNTTVVKTTDGFKNRNGCLVLISNPKLGPGNSVVISAQPFSYDPTGHKLRATITLCPKTGLNGACVTSSIVFTP